LGGGCENSIPACNARMNCSGARNNGQAERRKKARSTIAIPRRTRKLISAVKEAVKPIAVSSSRTIIPPSHR
jgi:hypothetical protein